MPFVLKVDELDDNIPSAIARQVIIWYVEKKDIFNNHLVIDKFSVTIYHMDLILTVPRA